VALGPCGLTIANLREGDAIMTPPYVLNLMYRPSADEAVIGLTGTGWGRARVTVTGPGKAVDAIVEAQDMNSPDTFFMNEVGIYHYRLTDDRCTRVFDMEVRPRVSPSR
jgi:hypothetical protein